MSRRGRSNRRLVRLAAVVLVVVMGAAVGIAGDEPDVWFVRDGSADAERAADRPFNPASLAKLATTLWALEMLGPDHRFETTVGYRGRLDRETGVIDGDLLVRGGADPDFHLENAWLVARALNEAGVRRVTGDLLVDRRIWIGWEGGSERRLRDPLRRAAAMAARLRDALDPQRYDRAAREGIAAFHERRRTAAPDSPAPAREPVRVEILGRGRGVRRLPTFDGTLIVHRSNPLVRILKRFNSYSNNDIERLGEVLGDARDLTAFVRRRLGRGDGGPRFGTLSGLGSNRMSARDVVELIDALRDAAQRMGHELDELLPVVGCDPGTLEQFSTLAGLSARGVRIAAKTGSLSSTDGGVATLAGHVGGADGITFCAASLATGGRLGPARRMQDRWLAARLAANGPFQDPDRPSPPTCGRNPLVFSDAEASVSTIPPVIRR